MHTPANTHVHTHTQDDIVSRFRISGWLQLPGRLATINFRARTGQADQFRSCEFVDWLLEVDICSSRNAGVCIGQRLVEANFITNVETSSPMFADSRAMYRLTGINQIDVFISVFVRFDTFLQAVA